jgi:hypothetical protein
MQYFCSYKSILHWQAINVSGDQDRRVCKVLNAPSARLRAPEVARSRAPQLEEVLAQRLRLPIDLYTTFGYRRYGFFVLAPG